MRSPGKVWADFGESKNETYVWLVTLGVDLAFHVYTDVLLFPQTWVEGWVNADRNIC